MTSVGKLLLVVALTACAFLLGVNGASAAGMIIPHGGYDTSTDACLQCHDIHEAAGDYVLLRWSTVTDTCGSCHYLYSGRYPSTVGGSFGQGEFSYNTPLAGARPAYDPKYSGHEIRSVLPTGNSIGARTSAYEVAWAAKDAAPGHNLQRGSGSFLFKDGKLDNAGYIPGGFDRLTAIQKASYPNTVPATSFSGTNGLFCASCHTPHGNFGQELLKTGASEPVGPKILSGKPNHSATALRIDNWDTDGSKWCKKCHGKRDSEAVDPATGAAYHNHPDIYCLQCHTNDSNGLSSDFPHTGANENLLQQEPDGLCLLCHKKGALP